jgi:hypothetical protein
MVASIGVLTRAGWDQVGDGRTPGRPGHRDQDGDQDEQEDLDDQDRDQVGSVSQWPRVSQWPSVSQPVDGLSEAVPPGLSRPVAGVL